jgi:AraC-like DNA-binding protein
MAQSTLPALHALDLTDIFELIGVSASILSPGRWRAIHQEPSVVPFELRFGLDIERVKYNERCVRQAESRRTLVIGRHAGFWDVFMPIVVDRQVVALVVAGPVARQQPESGAITEQWRWLSGRQPDTQDPEFAEYLATCLSTLVLDRRCFQAFQDFLRGLALLIAQRGSAKRVLAKAEALRPVLEQARSVERMWETARSMVDPRKERSWPSAQRLDEMRRAGLSRAPDQVVVGMLAQVRPEADAVEALLQRRAFQRTCAELAGRTGEVIAGTVGDQGISFLAAAGSAGRRRRNLLALGERAAAAARKHGFTLHLGVSTAGDDVPLSVAFQAALAAAEGALVRGERVAKATIADRSGVGLHGLRRALGALAEENSRNLPARFDRYLERVALHYGYRVDAVRAHLEAGFERIADGVQARGVLGDRSNLELFEELERASREARGMQELFAAYRRAVSEMSRLAEQPVATRRDRSLQRAVKFIQEHYAQRMSLARVARAAGFAPNYFSQLFKRKEHLTFEHYLLRLRVERAKHLLASTELGMRRIAELSGFSSPNYFATAFKRATGTTPLDFRGVTLNRQSAAGGAAKERDRRTNI